NADSLLIPSDSSNVDYSLISSLPKGISSACWHKPFCGLTTMSLVNYELAPSSLQDESTRPDIWYILIIPGFGIVSHVISAFAGKPIFGYLGMVCKESSVAPNSQSSGKRSLLNTSAGNSKRGFTYLFRPWKDSSTLRPGILWIPRPN